MAKLILEAGYINDGPCWVCGVNTSLELHHIIPCAYGGVDGPQISLCAVDHSLVHALSFKLGKEVPLPELITSDERFRSMPVAEAKAAIKMAMFLGSKIKMARELVADDPNKKVKFNTQFSSETSRKLKELVQFLGCSNQEQALVHVIHETHARYLTRIPR